MSNEFLKSVLMLQEEIRRTTELSQQNRIEPTKILGGFMTQDGPEYLNAGDAHKPENKLSPEGPNVELKNDSSHTNSLSFEEETSLRSIGMIPHEPTDSGVAGVNQNFGFEPSADNEITSLSHASKGRSKSSGGTISQLDGFWAEMEANHISSGPNSSAKATKSMEDVTAAAHSLSIFPTQHLRGYEYQRLRMQIVGEIAAPYRRKIADLESRNEQNEDSFWHLRREYGEYRACMEKKLESAEAEARQAHEDAQTAQVRLRKELERLRAGDDSQVTVLKANNSRLERKVEELKLQNKELQSERAQLEEKLRNADVLLEKIKSDYKREVAELRTKLVTTEADMEPLKRRIAQLEEKLVKCSQTIRDKGHMNDTKENELNLLKQTLDDWEKAFEELRRRGTEEAETLRRAHHEEVKRLCSKITELKEDASSFQIKAAAAEEALKMKTNDIFQAEMNVEKAAREKIRRLQQDLEHTQQQLRVAKKATNFMESDGIQAMSEASERHANLTAEVSILRNENQNLLGKLKFFTAEVSKVKENSIELKEKLQQEQSKNIEALDIAKTNMKVMGELQAENASLKVYIEHLEADNKQLEEDFSQLSQEIDMSNERQTFQSEPESTVIS